LNFYNITSTIVQLSHFSIQPLYTIPQSTIQEQSGSFLIIYQILERDNLIAYFISMGSCCSFVFVEVPVKGSAVFNWSVPGDRNANGLFE